MIILQKGHFEELKSSCTKMPLSKGDHSWYKIQDITWLVIFIV